MKTLEAYVMTKDDPFLRVKAQVYPDMPFTMIYQLGARHWGAGDVEIGMSYNGKEYPSATAALQDIQKSNVLERAARTRNLRGFDKRKQEVMDKTIEENNVRLYVHLNSLKEANNGKESETL